MHYRGPNYEFFVHGAPRTQPLFRRMTNSRRGVPRAPAFCTRRLVRVREAESRQTRCRHYFLQCALQWSPVSAVRARRWSPGGISGIRSWGADAGRRPGENKKTHPYSFSRIRKRKGKKETFGSRSLSTVVSALPGSPSLPYPISLGLRFVLQ